MKFDKIAALCKKTKQVYVYNAPNDDEQWISDGCGMYRLEGVPTLTAEECLYIFGIPEERHHAYECFNEHLPSGIDFSNEYGVVCKDIDLLQIMFEWKGTMVHIFIAFSKTKQNSPNVETIR